MTINFFEPGDVPKPRDQVKIEKFEGEVYPDLRRVRVTLHITPFLERPNLAMALVKDERTVGEMSIIETMHNKMEFTLHMRGVENPVGEYTMKARLYYEPNINDLPEGERPIPQIFDQAETHITITAADLAALNAAIAAEQAHDSQS